MKFEIVEFYKFVPSPNKQPKKTIFYGTLHIFVIDYNLDIRGIKVFRKSRNSFFISFPDAYAYDPIEKKNVRYPIISFMKEEDKNEIMTFLKKEGIKYILEKEKISLKSKF